MRICDKKDCGESADGVPLGSIGEWCLKHSMEVHKMVKGWNKQ